MWQPQRSTCITWPLSTRYACQGRRGVTIGVRSWRVRGLFYQASVKEACRAVVGNSAVCRRDICGDFHDCEASSYRLVSWLPWLQLMPLKLSNERSRPTDLQVNNECREQVEETIFVDLHGSVFLCFFLLFSVAVAEAGWRKTKIGFVANGDANR